MPQAEDTLLRFLLPTAGVRGVIVHLDHSWHTIAGRSHYPDAIAQLLGEATVAAALFTGHIKVNGRLSVQLRSAGAISTLFAECTAQGGLRGIVRLREHGDAPAGDLRTLGEDALLAITIENPPLRGDEPVRYQGLIALQAARLETAFEHYFQQSEQLPTRLLLACDGTRAAGLMLQKLPGSTGDEDGFRRASALFDTLPPEELLAVPPATIIHRLFHEESPQLLDEKPLAFACSCSRERVEAMLVSLGRAEAEAAVAAGAGLARITCEFCGQEYRFDHHQIATLFTQAAASHPGPSTVQ